MLWALVVISFALWILGFAFQIAGGFVHLILALSLFMLVFNLATRQRTV